ncbi:response regulator transcription factor [Cyanobium sp. FGCU-6]|nr:response regulator transcription factor [Cyanobium sp. FGCU6]
MTLLWILEDDDRLCDLLVASCAELGWKLAAFPTPRRLEQALDTSTPDLLLLDQMLPGKPGTDVLTWLRRHGYGFPVLMLSALGAPSDRIAGLEAGADDYMAKPFLFRELQLRVEALLRRNVACPDLATTSSTGYQIGAVRFDPARRRLVGRTGIPVPISRGDTALLLALCRRPGEPVSREVLARSSGSLVDPGRSRTIDMRLSRLRRQLVALGDGEEMVQALRGQGYRLQVPVVPFPLEEA